MSLREIGEVIGVSAGTVSREIRRNCDMRGYHRTDGNWPKRGTEETDFSELTDEMLGEIEWKT